MWLRVDTTAKGRAKPTGKIRDERLREIAAKTYTPLLKWMVEMVCRNTADVDGTGAKIEKIVGDECESPRLVRVCGQGVHPALEARVGEVIFKGELLGDTHCVDEPAVTGAQ